MRSSTCCIELMSACSWSSMCNLMNSAAICDILINSTMWISLLQAYPHPTVDWCVATSSNSTSDLLESSEISNIVADSDEQLSYMRHPYQQYDVYKLVTSLYTPYCWLVCRNIIKFYIGSSRIIRNLNHRSELRWTAQLYATSLSTVRCV